MAQGLSRIDSRLGAALFLLASSSCLPTASALSCGECVTMQESIWRSIGLNITDLEAKAVAGSSTTATVEIGQIIWHVCGSDTWKEQRYLDSFTAACKETVREHVDTMTNYWKEKSSDEYKEMNTALRMKRAVCPNPEIHACQLDHLPSDYEPLRNDECDVCHAIVSDVFGMVRFSRDRPKSAKSDAYFRVVNKLSNVCQDLPMRHPMRANEKQDVLDLCEDVWDEHEATFLKIALKPNNFDFASNICADELALCEGATSVEKLYAGDPSSVRAKEEL